MPKNVNGALVHWIRGELDRLLSHPVGFPSRCGLPQQYCISYKGMRLVASPRQFWWNSDPLDLAPKSKEVRSMWWWNSYLLDLEPRAKRSPLYVVQPLGHVSQSSSKKKAKRKIQTGSNMHREAIPKKVRNQTWLSIISNNSSTEITHSQHAAQFHWWYHISALILDGTIQFL